jgi:hypothetical protein
VSARELDAEAAQLRDELTELIAELDRRRHELLDVKGQVRRHPWSVGLTGLAMSAAAIGAIALHHRRGQGRGLSAARARHRAPRSEPALREPTLLQRILGAAGSAAAVYLVRAGLTRVISSKPGRAPCRGTAAHDARDGRAGRTRRAYNSAR